MAEVETGKAATDAGTPLTTKKHQIKRDTHVIRVTLDSSVGEDQQTKNPVLDRTPLKAEALAHGDKSDNTKRFSASFVLLSFGRVLATYCG